MMAAQIPPKARDFLNERRIGILSLHRDGAAPHSSPVWYWLEGSSVFIMVAASTAKARLLRQPALASFVVQDESWPYRFVRLEGTAASIRARTADDADRMSKRYLGAFLGEVFAKSVTHEGMLIELAADKVTSEGIR